MIVIGARQQASAAKFAWVPGAVRPVTAVALLCLGGCANKYPVKLVPPVPTLAEAPQLYKPVVEAEYQVGIGDTLMLQSYYYPTLKQLVKVRPDGRISLLLLDEFDTRGKTVLQVRDAVRNAYAKLLDHPDITMSVEDSASLSVYVGGEVKAPSLQPLKGELTLTQCIMQAGGFMASANQEQIIILRQASDGHYRAMQFNSKKVLRNEAGELFLQRHDIIFVPKTHIADVDQFVEQYVNGVLPHALNFSFGYQFFSGGGSSGGTTVVSPVVTPAVVP